MPHRPPLASLLVCIALVGGCATGDTPAVNDVDLRSLAHGTAATEIVAKLGKPSAVFPVQSDTGVPSEIWEYRFPHQRKVSQEATGMVEVPAFDPLLRDGVGMKMVREMSIQTKTDVITKVVALQIRDGVLIASRVGYERETDFK